MYILVYVKWNVCITAIASCNIYIQYIIVSTSPSIWWGQHWVQPLPPTFIFLPFFFLFLYFVLYVFIIYLIFLQPRKIRSSLQCGLFDYNIFNSVSGFPVFFLLDTPYHWHIHWPVVSPHGSYNMWTMHMNMGRRDAVSDVWEHEGEFLCHLCVFVNDLTAAHNSIFVHILRTIASCIVCPAHRQNSCENSKRTSSYILKSRVERNSQWYR